ncbi:MAG: FG-GAP-like repeat-containing protein [Candidatus Electryonea clarkiae]|nr:FG-GAP-like repeat-containing protein [Candidatus Electryonea clarkiae]MDP8285807.1 FG-GAP-like repeat-containing protein [Candidatus Electryonea clarkiae]
MKFESGYCKHCFLAFVFVLMWVQVSSAQIEFTEHNLADNFDGPWSVTAADINSDGEIDILGASYFADDIKWWKNDGLQGFVEHTVDNNFDYATFVDAGDIDGDGDMDILASSLIGDDISWWENDGEQEFTEHNIVDDYDGAWCVSVVDLDEDGDMDVLGSAFSAGDITWWENDGEQNFTGHTIAADFTNARAAYAADIDGDGDWDVLGASQANEITWWENNGEQAFTEHTIANDFVDAFSVYAVDLDSDDDMDVLGAAVSDSIAWWENDGQQNFTEHVIVDDFGDAFSVYATDIDNDGDVDVLGAGRDDNDITWWENDGEQVFDDHTIESNFAGASSVYAADLDGDGDMDVMGAAHEADDVTWWENDLDPVGNANVDGTITNAQNGDPVAGADVSYGRNSGVTDDDGYYSIEGIVDRTYTIRVEAEDFITITETGVEVNEGDNTYDYEILHPPTISWAPDTLQLDAYQDFMDSTILTVGNEGGLDLTWQITPSSFWLAVNSERDTLEPGAEIEITVMADASGLGGGLYGSTLLFTTNDPANEEYEVPVSFNVRAPMPPSFFNLLEPLDENTVENPNEVETIWQQSTDSDDGEEVTYQLQFRVSLEDGSVDTIRINDLTDTTYTIDIPSELELEPWRGSLNVRWWVRAISGEDIVQCNRTFSFFLPSLSVPDQRFTGFPEEYALAAVYPNPFNPEISIIVGLPQPANLELSIYNILGEQVAVLVDGKKSQGYHTFTFDANGMASGIYFIQATVPEKMNELRKIILLR